MGCEPSHVIFFPDVFPMFFPNGSFILPFFPLFCFPMAWRLWANRFSCGVADIIANDQTLLNVEKTLKHVRNSSGETGETWAVKVEIK